MQKIIFFGRKISISRKAELPENTEAFPFSDKMDALRFLRSAKNQGQNMQVFRKVLHAESYCSPLYLLDDQQVLRVLSGLIYARRIILYDFEPRDMAERVSSGGDFSAFVEAKPRQRREPPRIVRQQRRPDQIMADIPVLVPEDIADAKRTWIEIQLIGEDDMPIANANYVLSGPGKHIVIRGTLDSNGLARHEKLMPGNYQVNFPELDKDAWEVV